MAKVNRCIPTTNIESYMNFVDGFNCQIVNVDFTNNTITIDNDVIIKVQENLEYTNGRDWIIIYNENTYTCLQQGVANLWLCCSESFVWLTVDSSDSNKICFLYEKIGDKKLCGHTYTAKSGNPDIHGVTLTDLTSQETYIHAKNLNYTCELVYPSCYDYLDYSEDVLVSNSLRSNITDTNTLTSSIVTQNKILSFSGANYFALGTNAIIRAD